MKIRLKRTIPLLAAGLLLGSAALAGVTSKPAVVLAYPNQDFYVPLQLQTSAGEIIGGINGQMQYDPALFVNPVVQAGEGYRGFIAVSNLVAPGKLRFVIYADPTQAADLGSVTMFVKMTGAPVLPRDGASTITFLNGPIDPNNPDKPGESAVGTTAGVSVPSVSFASVQVVLNKNAASDWMLYR